MKKTIFFLLILFVFSCSTKKPIDPQKILGKWKMNLIVKKKGEMFMGNKDIYFRFNKNLSYQIIAQEKIASGGTWKIFDGNKLEINNDTGKNGINIIEELTEKKLIMKSEKDDSQVVFIK